MSEVVRIGSKIIIHPSKLWKGRFSILCLVRLQGKFDIDTLGSGRVKGKLDQDIDKCDVAGYWHFELPLSLQEAHQSWRVTTRAAPWRRPCGLIVLGLAALCASGWRRNHRRRLLLEQPRWPGICGTEVLTGEQQKAQPLTRWHELGGVQRWHVIYSTRGLTSFEPKKLVKTIVRRKISSENRPAVAVNG